MSNPSTFLPSFGNQRQITLDSILILNLINRLEVLYRPRSTRLAALKSTVALTTDSGYSSEADEPTQMNDDESEIGKKIERNYGKAWLMALLKITMLSDWVEAVEISDDQEEIDRRLEVIERASSLIANLSETSVSGAIHRTIVLQTCDNPISITLLDALPTAEDPTSVGLQSWGASIILARRFSADPESYGIKSTKERRVRILELGSGTGLLALAAARLLERMEDDYMMEGKKNVIVATDFHEAVLANLQRNVDDNDISSSSTSTATTTIDVLPLDWSLIHESASTIMEPPLDQRFDLILGGDIIYRQFHSLWIHSCVTRFLAYPTPASPTPRFILIAPLRPTHTEAIASITLVFPHVDDLEVRVHTPDEGGEDWRLAIMSIESTDREYGVGRADEAGYRIYRMGWI